MCMKCRHEQEEREREIFYVWIRSQNDDDRDVIMRNGIKKLFSCIQQNFFLAVANCLKIYSDDGDGV